MKIKVSRMISIALLTITTSVSYAGVTLYTNQADFSVQGSILQNTNFDSYPAGWTFPSNPLVVGDLTLQAQGQALIGGNVYGFNRQNFTDNYVQGVSIGMNPTPEYNLFGFDAGNYYAGNAIFNLVTNLATYQYNESLNRASYLFFGFKADPGEYFVSFTDVPNSSAAGFTDIQIGTTSVPEPTTLSLLGLGLAAIGFGKRRKSS